MEQSWPLPPARSVALFLAGVVGAGAAEAEAQPISQALQHLIPGAAADVPAVAAAAEVGMESTEEAAALPQRAAL